MNVLTAAEYIQELTDGTDSDIREAALDEAVLDIIQTVREKKDAALKEYTKKFDGIEISDLIVSREEFLEAKKLATPQLIAALEKAAANIRTFHREQKEKSWFFSPEEGVILGQKLTPIDRVGVYVPGGKAGYPSTVLMTVIPAQIAGVEKIALTTPPGKDGKVNPYVLVAAELLGIEKVYKVGGAQAIAALAYGTETVEKVDKIVGPGNAYVARAKKWVFGTVGIDMIAGPSEICVIADEKPDPRYVAADLLSQAEHDEQARAIFITTSVELAGKVQKEVMYQLERLDRKEIAQTSIESEGKIIIVDDLDEAAAIANLIAPEHLELMIDYPAELLPKIKHAGAIFLGSYSPEPLGDYLAGPNHTLPTSGTAKFASGLGVDDFMKKSTVINYSEQALRRVSDDITSIATVEGLTAHANAIQIRKDDHDA